MPSEATSSRITMTNALPPSTPSDEPPARRGAKSRSEAGTTPPEDRPDTGLTPSRAERTRLTALTLGLVPAADVLDLADIEPATLRRWARDGKLDLVKLGNCEFVPLMQLQGLAARLMHKKGRG
jgi:hypothetical protein